MPEIPQIARKIYGPLFAHIFSHEDHISDDLQRKFFSVIFANQSTLEPIYFISNHVGHHFYTYFQEVCLDFQGFYEGFYRFCPDFQVFFPDFHQFKTFEGELAPLHPDLLHHYRVYPQCWVVRERLVSLCIYNTLLCYIRWYRLLSRILYIALDFAKSLRVFASLHKAARNFVSTMHVRIF